MKADLSVLIVNYNSREYLSNCIDSIFLSKTDLRLEVIVIDNNSNDNSIKLIESIDNRILIIKNDNNLGFSKAVNIGLQKCDAKYVCILNPDTIIGSDCISGVLKYMDQKEDIDCISPKIVNPNGTLQISCKRSLPKIRDSFFKLIGFDKFFPSNKFFSRYNLLYLDENKTHQVEVISGACMFLRKKTIDLVGYFDESFFLYGEDIDYCHRMNKLQMKVVYFPNYEVTHFKGVSAESRPYQVIFEFHDSMIKYFIKYQDEYFIWKYVKVFIVSIIIIKKYLSYFVHLLKNKIK